MRVLHVIPSVAPRDGGPSAAIGPMCRALSEQGIDLLLVSTDADGTERLNVPVNQPTTWQGAPALFFRRNFSESFKFSRGLAAWIKTHVREFDVVHIHAVLSHASMVTAAAARRAGIPYVIRPLGTLAPWSLTQHSFRKRALLMMGARHLLQSAAAIHCTSESERREIQATFGLRQGIVIPLGIDPVALETEPVSWPERERDPYVLALSRIHPKKNLEALIDAFAEVVGAGTADSSRWRLVLAGTGDPAYQAALASLIRQRGVEDRVSFVGWVDGVQKRELIRRASLFALLSLHENFGLSVLEAQAAGVPALVSESVDLAEAIAEARSGWVCALNRRDLTTALARALGEAAARRSMSGSARHLAASYTWPMVAARLVTLYNATHQPPHMIRADSNRPSDVTVV